MNKPYSCRPFNDAIVFKTVTSKMLKTVNKILSMFIRCFLTESRQWLVPEYQIKLPMVISKTNRFK